MNDSPNPSATSIRARDTGKVLREGLLVALMGLVFAWCANQISPRGLVLTRDFFPGATRPTHPMSTTTNLKISVAGHHTNALLSAEQLAARLKTKGLQLADSNQVIRLFRDPRYEQELVVFIDAREDKDYQEGHIPAAYQLDHYHPENYLATVLPVCQTADQIVVYCNGGDCEDSEFTAVTLSQAGIAATKLWVYGGGLSEWTTNGLPIEIGERKSGLLRQPEKQ